MLQLCIFEKLQFSLILYFFLEISHTHINLIFSLFCIWLPTRFYSSILYLIFLIYVILKI